MLLVFREHLTNLEMYVVPECPHEDYEYAEAMIKHFKMGISGGITSKKELEQFKILVKMHGHELHIIKREANVIRNT